MYTTGMLLLGNSIDMWLCSSQDCVQKGDYVHIDMARCTAPCRTPVCEMGISLRELHYVLCRVDFWRIFLPTSNQKLVFLYACFPSHYTWMLSAGIKHLSKGTKFNILFIVDNCNVVISYLIYLGIVWPILAVKIVIFACLTWISYGWHILHYFEQFSRNMY